MCDSHQPLNGADSDDYLDLMLDDELRRVEAGVATPQSIRRVRETFARLSNRNPEQEEAE